MRIGENAETKLHSLFAVRVKSFLLMTLKKCANCQDGINCHLVVFSTKILLGFNRQLSHCDCEAASNVVIIGVYQGSSEGRVILSIGGTTLCLKYCKLIMKYLPEL